jgi:tetratricopeptide (TPR) repeat protein
MQRICLKGYLYSQPDTAFILANKMYDFAVEKKLKHYQVFALQVMGTSFSLRGDNIRGIDYFTRGLKIAEEINNYKDMANNLNNIGVIYAEQGNNKKAMEYYQRSLELSEKFNKKTAMAFALGNLGSIYKNLGQYDKAIEAENRSLKLSEENNDKNGYANALYVLGVIYSDQNDLEKSMDFSNRALKLFEEFGDKNSVSNVMTIIGLNYQRTNQTKKAIEILKKALAISKEGEFITGMREASLNLYDIYKKEGKAAEALAMHELYIAMRDSIQSEKNQQEVMQKEMQYTFEKQKALDDKENEKQLAISAEKEQKQKIISYSITTGLIFVLLFAFFVFNRLRLSNKQKIIIESQKDLVEAKQKEILDSINYAKRLQDAILPPARFVKEHLPESFIFYKPKDIVAGDFYWMEVIRFENGKWNKIETNKPSDSEIILMAVADCTGHGVPGAMVSIVCSNALNRAVFEFGMIEPGKILDKTRELVLETFSKSDKDVKDGMDISFLSINKGSKEIKWAGANSPIWYTKENELIEIKADKQPIGKTVNPSAFTTHSIQLQQGNSLFMLTDGFADQFGGERGKKFKYKALKEMLLQNANLTQEKQMQSLEIAFKDWKTNLEQVDDVCVIGVRI